MSKVLLLKQKNQAFVEMADINTACALVETYSSRPAQIKYVRGTPLSLSLSLSLLSSLSLVISDKIELVRFLFMLVAAVCLDQFHRASSLDVVRYS